jgi:hypothetical protein
VFAKKAFSMHTSAARNWVRSLKTKCDPAPGRFGFWPKWSDFLAVAQLRLEQAGLPLYFVEGNHEQYPQLLKPFPQAGRSGSSSSRRSTDVD